jgi:hypothetical protein
MLNRCVLVILQNYVSCAMHQEWSVRTMDATKFFRIAESPQTFNSV